MTLPASFPLSLSQIAAELGLSLPLSISHPWVIALAGKSALPVSFSDLLGKTGSFTAGVTFQMGSGANFGSVNSTTPLGALFSAGIIYMDNMGDQSGSSARIFFSTPPNWSGNFLLTNQNTGGTALLTKQNSTTWATTSGAAGTFPGGLLPAGGTTSATMSVKPSN